MKRPAEFTWAGLGLAYRAFSTLCDDDDWAHIVENVAFSMAANNPNELRVLDVGAGVGATSYYVRRRLYGSHNVASHWSLFDPDALARTFQPILMPTLGRALSVQYLDEMPLTGSFDSICFCHTTYYVSDLKDTLSLCAKSLLRKQGMIIVVAMPEHSAFFLPDKRNLCTGLAEDVVASMRELGLRTETHTVQSRFRWREGARSDQALGQFVADFVMGRRGASPEDVAAVQRHFAGTEVDFADQVIVGWGD